MTTLYTEADRENAIRNFIFARSKKLVQIISYEGIKDCLEEQRVNLLCTLQKSGSYQKRYSIDYVYYFTEKDAQTYFEWLVSVVTGTRNASSDIYKQAINQLFMFLFVLDNTLDSNDQVTLLTPYSLDKELTTLDEKILKVKKKVESMDKQIVDTLEKILNWQQKYQPYLDRMVKDFDKMSNAFKRNDNK